MAQERFKEPTDIKEKLWECEKKEGGGRGGRGNDPCPKR